MGLDAAVVIARDQVPVGAIASAARVALPSTEVVILVSDEGALPMPAQKALGAATTASLWSTVENPEAFHRFVLSISLGTSQGAVGVTVIDHACVGAFLVARQGRPLNHGEVEGDGYLALLPTAVERAFDISLGLTSDDVLFFTERLLEAPKGYRLPAGGGPPIPLTSAEVLSVQEGAGAFADYECLLGV